MREAITIEAEAMNPEMTPLHTDLEIIARWCAERGIRDSSVGRSPRRCTAICGVRVARITRSARGVCCLPTRIGIEVEGKFANGLVLALRLGRTCRADKYER